MNRWRSPVTYSFDSERCNAEHGCSSHSQHKLGIGQHEVNGCADPIVIFLPLTVSIHPRHPTTANRRDRQHVVTAFSLMTCDLCPIIHN